MASVTRSPRLGYALAATAATFWAVNGALAKFVLDEGVSAWRLSELRAFVSFVLLAGFLALTDRGALRVDRPGLRQLAFYGICGLAIVHTTYFLAIERLDIGVALVVQYLGPLLILIWLAAVHGRRLQPSLWAAVTLAVLGSALVVQVYDIDALDGLGLAAAFASAVTFAVAMVTSERAGARYPAQTTLAYGFGFATLFWFVVQPPHTFPFDQFDSLRMIALGAGVAVVGTLIPFFLMVAAVRHIPASRAAIIATLEPVLGALIAWPVHDQALAAPQIAGGITVVAAVIWVQSHKPEYEAEGAPLKTARAPADQ
jgi:drug/metabolite transporter (DMT)-like permease